MPLTAAVRDLHKEHRFKYQTDVITTAMSLWEHNPYITKLEYRKEYYRDGPDTKLRVTPTGPDKDAKVIECHYPLINESNNKPNHFIQGYHKFLEKKLGINIPVTDFRGDIHISQQEKSWISQVQEKPYELDKNFWIIMAGGKFDYTTKWWNPIQYQQVVDYFQGKIKFVQCGQADHWHPKLRNVINLIGKTNTRQFIRLVYHSAGIVCPITFAMHLAAAVPTKPNMPKNRACVVIAGGREPPQWEAYPYHQFIHTMGALPCCETKACWKSRCQTLQDGDHKDEDLCERPVMVSNDLRIPECMAMITAHDVIRRIEMYYSCRDSKLRYFE